MESGVDCLHVVVLLGGVFTSGCGVCVVLEEAFHIYRQHTTSLYIVKRLMRERKRGGEERAQRGG